MFYKSGNLLIENMFNALPPQQGEVRTFFVINIDHANDFLYIYLNQN